MIVIAELRQAWRASLRRPGFLALATLTLALGIGASVAVLALVDRVLLRPLPYPAPGQLFAAGLLQGDGSASITPREYQAIGDLEGIAASGLASHTPLPVNLAEADDPQMARALWVDARFLAALAPAMPLGRGFAADEDRPGAGRAVVISHRLWQARFGGDPQAVGRTLSIEGEATPVIGVLPADFRYAAPFDLLLPLALPSASTDDGRNFLAIVRLADGAGAQAVAGEVDRRLHGVYAGTPGERWYATSRFGLRPLSGALGASSRPLLLLFLGGALCVLLLATVNLVNLMLLRSLARSHVNVIRSALGASTARLAMPQLAEGLLVAIAGVAGGLLLAERGLHLAAGWIPPSWFGGEADLGLGGLAWGFAVASGLLVALLAAGLGVWRGRSGAGSGELVAGGRSGLGRGAGRLARTLVVTQVALAALLLTGAGLFARSLAQSATVDLGYRIEGRLGFELAPVRARFPDSASSKALAQRLLERLQAQPGVISAAAGTNLPIGAPLNYSLQVPGGEMFSVELRGISPGFLDAFSIPLRAGRDVLASDVPGGAAVALVNEAFMRAHLASGPAAGAPSAALGGLLEVPDPESGALLPLRIVGVVGDTRQHGPEAAAPPMVYLPLAQVPDGLLQLLRDFAPLRFAVHVQGEPAGHAAAIRAAVAEVAPGQPIAHLQPLAELVRDSTDGTRLNLLLVGAFAALAVLLSAVGLYAVVAVAGAARRREFGVRSALGARTAGLLGLVLRDGLRQVLLGLALGLAAALALSRVLQAYLAGTSASDPLVLLAVAAVLASVALLACLVPAVRAARTDPVIALRQE